MNQIIEEKAQFELSQLVFKKLGQWHKEGKITDSISKEAWEIFDDMEDPNCKLLNWKDESWVSVGDEIILMAITMPMTMGTGSLVRGGLGLAWRLAAGGAARNVGVRAGIFLAGSAAEGFVQEAMNAGLTGQKITTEGVGIQMLMSVAFHGGGKGWGKAAASLGVDEAAIAVARAEGRSVGGKILLNRAGTMATQTTVATFMSYATDYLHNNQEPRTFWERFGGEALRMTGMHYGAEAFHGATGRIFENIEKTTQMRLQIVGQVYHQSRSVGFTDIEARKLAIAVTPQMIEKLINEVPQKRQTRSLKKEKNLHNSKDARRALAFLNHPLSSLFWMMMGMGVGGGGNKSYAFIDRTKIEAGSVHGDVLAQQISMRAGKVSIPEHVKERILKLLKKKGEANQPIQREVDLDLLVTRIKLGDETAWPLLRERAQHPDYAFRKMLPEALVKIGGQQSLELLCEMLKDRSDDVKANVAKALGKIGSPEAVEVLFGMANHANPELRRVAVQQLGDIAGQEVLNKLREMMKDSDRFVRQDVAKAVGKFLGKQHLNRLEFLQAAAVLRAMIEDPSTRLIAVGALGKIKDPEALRVLDEMTRDPDLLNRKIAILERCKVGDEQSLRILRQLAQGSDNLARQDAVEILGNVGSQEALDILREITKDDAWGNDWIVRRKAAASLGKIGGKEAVEVLRGMTEDYDPFVREGVAEALGSIGSPEAVEVLRGMLKDNAVQVREKAAEVLATAGDKETLPILEAMDINTLSYKAIADILDNSAALAADPPPVSPPLSLEARLAKYIKGRVGHIRDRLGKNAIPMRGFHNGGKHRSRRHSPRGMDLADLREIKDGEPITGRIHELNGVIYQEQHHLNQGGRVIIAVDPSVLVHKNRDEIAAAGAAGTLAEIALSQGDSVGLLIGTGSDRTFLSPREAKTAQSVVSRVMQPHKRKTASPAGLLDDPTLKRNLPPGSVVYLFGNYYSEANLAGLQRVLDGRRAMGITVIPVQFGSKAVGPEYSVRVGRKTYAVHREYSEGKAKATAYKKQAQVEAFLQRNGGMTVQNSLSGDTSRATENAVNDILFQQQQAPGLRNHQVILEPHFEGGVVLEIPQQPVPRDLFDRMDLIKKRKATGDFINLVREAKQNGWGVVLDWVEEIKKSYQGVVKQNLDPQSKLGRPYIHGLQDAPLPPPEAWGYTDETLGAMFLQYVEKSQKSEPEKAGEAAPALSLWQRAYDGIRLSFGIGSADSGGSEIIDQGIKKGLSTIVKKDGVGATTTGVTKPKAKGKVSYSPLMKLSKPLSGGSEYLILGMYGNFDKAHGTWKELPEWTAQDIARGGGERVGVALGDKTAFQDIPGPLGGKVLRNQADGQIEFELSASQASKEMGKISVETFRERAKEIYGDQYGELTQTVPLDSMPPEIQQLIANIQKMPVEEAVDQIQRYVVQNFEYHGYEGIKLEMFEKLQERAKGGQLEGPNEYLQFVLAAGGGKCAELSELTVTLLRLAGIPAEKGDGYLAEGKEVREPLHAVAVALLPAEGGGFHPSPVETSKEFMPTDMVEALISGKSKKSELPISTQPAPNKIKQTVGHDHAPKNEAKNSISEPSSKKTDGAVTPTDTKQPVTIEQQWQQRWDQADAAGRVEMSKIWEYYTHCLMYRGQLFRGVPVEEIMLDPEGYARFTPSQVKPPSYWMDTIRAMKLTPTPEVLARFQTLLPK